MESEQQVQGFVQRWAQVSGRRLRYLESGTGAPVILLHGAPGLEANLCGVHEELAREYRLLAPELPGFGETRSDGIESVRDLADVVRQFATALGLDRYSVIGTSLGGYVGAWVGADDAQRVSRLVLDAPTAFRTASPPGGQPPYEVVPDAARMAYLGRICGPPTDQELIDAMPGCRVPTLVLLGERDPLFPPRFAADYKRFPGSTVGIVYNAGHDLKRDRPEAYVATIRDYLARGQAFVVSERSTVIHP